MRIAHFGAYGINIGDNIALRNVRRGIEDAFEHSVIWTPVNILDFHKHKNNIEFCKTQFKKISEENDLFVIGGGGLLEGGVYNTGFETGYKLPFTSETLESLTIPIVVFAVGVNYFRKVAGFTPRAAQQVKNLLEKSVLFSVRNDGSKEAITTLLSGSSQHIHEIPDPGLLYLKESAPKECLNKEQVFFQPAWNGDSRVLVGRFIHDKNVHDIAHFVAQHNMSIVPHSPKDYNFVGLPRNRFMVSLKEFRALATLENVYNFTDKYVDFDAVVAMRGHGQMISIGSNVPSLYLSTQNKVTGFSEKNGFKEYNIDILENNWRERLQNSYNKLMTDRNFVAQWYEIREKCMKKCRKEFTTYCLSVKNSI